MTPTVETIWENFASQLRSFIRARVRDHAVAEDILLFGSCRAHIAGCQNAINDGLIRKLVRAGMLFRESGLAIDVHVHEGIVTGIFASCTHA